MTTVSPKTSLYWGEGGEYGPFDAQTEGEWEGFPDFGQVQQYFRIKANMSQKQFGEIYGKETKPDGSPISVRQVRRMERENELPTDVNRRKLIARLLNIPPTLFGLATVQDILLQPHPEGVGTILTAGRTMLPRVVADTSKYQSNIRTFVTLHYTSQVQSALDQINADIRDLESLESQAQGDLRYHVRELLFSYHLLAAKVVRDQRNFTLSYHYANQGVRVAKATRDADLIATALYTRARTYLQWGRCGTLIHGVFHIKVDKIDKAIRDFETAKEIPEDSKVLHPQILGLIDVHLARAYAIRSLSTGEQVPAIAFTLLDNAEGMADEQIIHDPYERHLITGSLTGFVKGEYHNNKAVGLTLMGKPGAALKEIDTLESLREGAIGKDLTRKQIWLDIVTADSYMGLQRYEEATQAATRALLASKDINSVSNLAYVVDIHGRLLQSSYKGEDAVKGLGDMVQSALIKHIE